MCYENALWLAQEFGEKIFRPLVKDETATAWVVPAYWYVCLLLVFADDLIASVIHDLREDVEDYNEESALPRSTCNTALKRIRHDKGWNQALKISTETVSKLDPSLKVAVSAAWSLQKPRLDHLARIVGQLESTRAEARTG